MKSKIINEMKLILPAAPENEAVARGCVSQFLSRADPTVTRPMQIAESTIRLISMSFILSSIAVFRVVKLSVVS